MTYQEKIAGMSSALAELGLMMVELRRENEDLKLRLAAQDSGACPCGACAGLAPSSVRTTIEAPPPDDLLDRITPAASCAHRRVSARPDAHGRPILAVCLDCDAELET